ncbi:hypothetical protein LCGC14_2017290 [marine sediment metagenome]|uniref:Uncharacterized protein n=1 Tax=marine sediment metagenome TaxID=412755 RepID=A0A0F9EYR4_9ZZZZ
MTAEEKLKDKYKAYSLTEYCIKTFNRLGRLLLYNEIKAIHRSSLIGDYVITLKGGGEIDIDVGVIRKIIEMESKSNT